MAWIRYNNELMWNPFFPALKLRRFLVHNGKDETKLLYRSQTILLMTSIGAVLAVFVFGPRLSALSASALLVTDAFLLTLYVFWQATLFYDRMVEVVGDVSGCILERQPAQPYIVNLLTYFNFLILSLTYIRLVGLNPLNGFGAIGSISAIVIAARANNIARTKIKGGR